MVNQNISSKKWLRDLFFNENFLMNIRWVKKDLLSEKI